MINIFRGRKRSLGIKESSTFVQMDVDFRKHLHLFKGSRLAVFLAIGLHINEEGWAWPSYELLEKETGYNKDTVRQALADLCALKINGHRVLLRFQPTSEEERAFNDDPSGCRQNKARSGQILSNRYLIFPDSEEVARYEGGGIRHLGYEAGGGFKSKDDTDVEQSPDDTDIEQPPDDTVIGKPNDGTVIGKTDDGKPNDKPYPSSFEEEEKPKEEISNSKPPSSIFPSASDEFSPSGLLEVTIAKLSRTFGDLHHVKSNVTRAINLWDRTAIVEEQEFVLKVEEAAARTKECVSKSMVRNRDKKMPYFFTILEDLLGLK